MHHKADIRFMKRALRLASNGGTAVKLNPQVGCIIVHKNRIIGEGFHKAYGKEHAEINALRSISAKDKVLLPESSVYVTLEPCSHFGKTPPCAQALVEAGVKEIFIGCQDPNIKVAGRGIAYLREHGIQVHYPFLEVESMKLIEKFTIHIQKQVPYICLKWAQSSDGYIGESDMQIPISGPKSQYWVHRWRTEFQAILVGSGTVLTDNPRLDNRLLPGNSPDRIILDRRQRLQGTEKVFRKDACTTYYCTVEKHNRKIPNHVVQLVMPRDNFLAEVLKNLYTHNISSILVEGGAQVHQSLIDAMLYDEVRIIENNRRLNIKGVKAAHIKEVKLQSQMQVDEDTIYFLK